MILIVLVVVINLCCCGGLRQRSRRDFNLVVAYSFLEDGCMPACILDAPDSCSTVTQSVHEN